ncbi:MAG TPA: NIPSNAP family protein [Nitrososphaerales archaeon]|nr:NIPSNAP family protein [Nitrososphaerales archaeon]
MIYEWRVYKIIPGKKKNLNERFAKHTAGLFEKHGMSVVGFWESSIGGRTNTLYYMLAFKNLDHLESAWKDFASDPEWQQVQSESERDGPLVASIRNMVLKPTYYSPMQ